MRNWTYYTATPPVASHMKRVQGASALDNPFLVAPYKRLVSLIDRRPPKHIQVRVNGARQYDDQRGDHAVCYGFRK